MYASLGVPERTQLLKVSFRNTGCLERFDRLYFLNRTYCQYFSDCRWGCGLMTGFIGLFDTAHDYTSQFTFTHTPVSTATSSLLLLGSSFQWRMFSFLCVPALSSASATSFSQQQFTMTEPQQFSDSLTDWLTDWLQQVNTGPTYNIWAWTA
jgi:hypothetical protein